MCHDHYSISRGTNGCIDVQFSSRMTRDLKRIIVTLCVIALWRHYYYALAKFYCWGRVEGHFSGYPSHKTYMSIWKTWKGDKFLLMLDAFDIPGIDEKGMSCTLPSILQSSSVDFVADCQLLSILAQYDLEYGHEHDSGISATLVSPRLKFCVTVTWITAHIYRNTCFLFYIAVWPVYFKSTIVVRALVSPTLRNRWIEIITPVYTAIMDILRVKFLGYTD